VQVVAGERIMRQATLSSEGVAHRGASLYFALCSIFHLGARGDRRMIRYTLKCSEGHRFESWFGSANSYESLLKAGHVTCPDCGGSTVEKALMAPQVRPARKAMSAEKAPDPTAPPDAPAAGTPGPLSAPASVREAAIAEFKRRIEANSEYVGVRFAAEARRIHSGEAPGRMIHGEARPDEARALIEEGVPVAPLPFLPGRKTN